MGEGRGYGRGQEVMRQGVAGMRHTFASIMTVISAMALGRMCNMAGIVCHVQGDLGLEGGAQELWSFWNCEFN